MIPNVTFDSVNSSYMIWLELNSKIPPFDNVKVRQAMNYAMPRDEIIRTIYYGQADPLTAPMPYIYPDATSDFFDYGYDLAKAKALLAEAGFKDGFSTTLSYNAGDPTQEPIALLYPDRRCARSASISRWRNCRRACSTRTSPSGRSR